MTTKLKDIKRAQKESLLLREIKNLFVQVALDNPKLAPLTIHRVELSQDKGTCNIYFYCVEGEQLFKKLFDTLILYKPSLRASLAQSIRSRYVPQIKFRFDTKYEKEKKIHELLDKIKEEDQS